MNGECVVPGDRYGADRLTSVEERITRPIRDQWLKLSDGGWLGPIALRTPHAEVNRCYMQAGEQPYLGQISRRQLLNVVCRTGWVSKASPEACRGHRPIRYPGNYQAGVDNARYSWDAVSNSDGTAAIGFFTGHTKQQRSMSDDAGSPDTWFREYLHYPKPTRSGVKRQVERENSGNGSACGTKRADSQSRN